MHLIVDMRKVGVTRKAQARDRLLHLDRLADLHLDALVLKMSHNADLAVAVIDRDVVAEDHGRGICRELGRELRRAPRARRRIRERDVVGHVADGGYDGACARSANRSAEPGRLPVLVREGVVLRKPPAVRTQAELSGERVVGIDATVR